MSTAAIRPAARFRRNALVSRNLWHGKGEPNPGARRVRIGLRVAALLKVR
jgi:hypothetical protein